MSNMNTLASQIAQWRQEKDFHTPATIFGDDADAMLGKLMLVVTEVAEAAEAVRKGDPRNFAEEIADTVIRLLDICGTTQIDIERLIKAKMVVNEARPQRHGKKTRL